MKFYKGCESLSFFISTYVVFLLHIIFVYSVDDKSSEKLKETNNTLIMHKEIFSVLFIFTFISHLITSLTDPGIIEADNYLETLESYNYIYKEINQIKERYNFLIYFNWNIYINLIKDNGLTKDKEKMIVIVVFLMNHQDLVFLVKKIAKFQ